MDLVKKHIQAIIISCFLTFLLYVVNTSLNVFFPTAGIIGPITEESFRAFSMWVGGPLFYVFTLVMAFLEIWLYVFWNCHRFFGEFPWWCFKVRICIFFIHLIYFGIQCIGYYFYKKYNKKLYWICGILAAMTAHWRWNVVLAPIMVRFFYEIF